MRPPPDPLQAFRAEAERVLREGLAALGAPEVEPRLTRAPPGRGDFAFACHPLAAKLRKAPDALAEELLGRLPRSEALAAQADGPYVNLTLDGPRLADAVLGSALGLGERYGFLPRKGQSVIVEHTSANPTGPFHVGRARNPIIGDTLARVLRAAGNDVATEYYVNDMGLQVVTLNWGARNLRPDQVKAAERPKPDHQLVSYYQKASELLEGDPATAKAIRDLLHRYERGADEGVRAEVRGTVEHMLGGMRESLERLRVRVDAFAFESTYVFNRDVERVLEKLKQSPRIREEEGAPYLDLEGLGVAGKSQKFFLARSDGTTLYPVRDVAYHLDKFRRSDRAINVLGEDHKLEAKQLSIALREIGQPRAPEVVFYAFVKLPEGRMSTRKGTVVYMDDLLDEAEERALAEVRKRRPDLGEEEMRSIARLVGMGAVRFNIASVQAEKAITFKWEEALDFEGASAPFVQYAHARAASILRKARDEGLEPAEPGPEVAARLGEPNELALVRTLARLPGLVQQCAQDIRVHPLAAYAVEVAGAFNQFYRDSPVLQAEPGVREARLALVVAAKHALRNTLDLLGIEAPESM